MSALQADTARRTGRKYSPAGVYPRSDAFSDDIPGVTEEVGRRPTERSKNVVLRGCCGYQTEAWRGPKINSTARANSLNKAKRTRNRVRGPGILQVIETFVDRVGDVLDKLLEVVPVGDEYSV